MNKIITLIFSLMVTSSVAHATYFNQERVFASLAESNSYGSTYLRYRCFVTPDSGGFGAPSIVQDTVFGDVITIERDGTYFVFFQGGYTAASLAGVLVNASGNQEPTNGDNFLLTYSPASTVVSASKIMKLVVGDQLLISTKVGVLTAYEGQTHEFRVERMGP